MTIFIGPRNRGGSPSALDAEILRDAPHGYWKCDETSGTTLVDSSGNGFDLTLTGTYTLAESPLFPIGGTNYIRFSGAGGYASRSGTMGLSTPFNRSMSACILIKRFTADPVYAFVISNSGETEADNFQFLIGVSPTELIANFWETTGAVNVAVEEVGAGATYATHMIHTVKDAVNKRVRHYLDGRLVWTLTYTDEPTGGSNCNTYLGGDLNSAVTNAVLGHVAFFDDTILSEARIHAHAQAAGRILR